MIKSPTDKSMPGDIWRSLAIGSDISEISVTHTGVYDPYGDDDATKTITTTREIRGIFCQSAGDYNLRDATGTVLTYSLLAGVVYPLCPDVVEVGEADGLFGIY